MKGSLVGKIILSLIFCGFLFNAKVNAQKYWEFGLSAGTSYYLGDVNHARQFYSPSPAIGAFLRYAYGLRWQYKASLVGGALRGDDLDFYNQYQQMRAHRFKTPILDLSTQVEFNFKPYRLVDSRRLFSPYVFAGATFLIASWTPQPYQPAIPFGTGIKVNFMKYMALNVEWGFRKTFTDELDNLTWYKNLPVEELTPYSRLNKQKGYFRQKDWYSLFLVSISFKIISNDSECHLYSM